jgi:C-methyltransferase
MKLFEESDLDSLRRKTLIYAALRAWGGQGIFEALAGGQVRTAADLGVSERGLDVTGQVIQELGLVRREDAGWELTPLGGDLWARGVLDLLSAEDFFGTLAKIDQVLSTGNPARETTIGVLESDPEHTRSFLEMLHRRSETSAAATADILGPLLCPSARILDVGGGHGRYGEVLRLRFGSRMTLLDFEVAVALAEERYGSEQAYIVGDFMDCELGGPYDAVLLSNIVHGLGPEELGRLLGRLVACLVPGGLLVMKDMFVGGGCEPEIAAAFGVQMLLGTQSGRSYSVDQITELVAAKGFAHPSCYPVPTCGFSVLVSAAPGA